MIKFILGNPWLILGVLAALAVSHGLVAWKAYSAGSDSEIRKQEQAIEKAENKAAGEIIKTKQEAQIVYKYIREQENSCDIYSNLIDRLPEPSAASR